MREKIIRSILLAKTAYMTSQFIENTVYLVILILLPIVPAYLLFKSLPSTADVTSVFKGRQIKLTGAFAGYFLLFYICMLQFKSLIQPDEIYQVWTLSGTVVDAANNRPVDDTRNPKIAYAPPSSITNGVFQLKIVAEKKIDRIEFPRLSVKADSFETYNLQSLSYDISKGHKDINSWQMDDKNKTADFIGNIILHRDSANFINTNHALQ